MTLVRSISSNQQEILGWIRDLHCGGKFDCDVTFGSGSFWNGSERPNLAFDIDPLRDDVVQADSRSLPLPDGSLDSVVFDPPFLTYIRSGRTGNGDMALGKRFSGYWSYADLSDHYSSTIDEASRVLRHGGVLVVKCQDIVHNHRLHPTHINVIEWGARAGMRLKDIFILMANHRMPSPNRAGSQKHARIFHSYFLVLVKG